MTEAAKLEPCPFCGGEAVHGLGGQFDGSGVFPIAFCKACGAKTKQARDKKQAIDLWNRRPSSDPDAVRALELIASFPIDEQNQLKRDSDLIYGFNDWKLTVGDVRRARAAQRQLPAGSIGEWPSGCHDPESCYRHQDCMYLNCAWRGKHTVRSLPASPSLTEKRPPSNQEGGK